MKLDTKSARSFVRFLFNQSAVAVSRKYSADVAISEQHATLLPTEMEPDGHGGAIRPAHGTMSQREISLAGVHR